MSHSLVKIGLLSFITSMFLPLAHGATEGARLKLTQLKTATSAKMGQEGNGGGGTLRDGRYVTFGSANLVVERESLHTADVPGLEPLLFTIGGAPMLTNFSKSLLLNALMPSNIRNYWRVKPEFFDQQTYKRIMAEYQRATGQSTKSLALFAVTDTVSRTTFLFPKFFALKPLEQQAILFHEAYWILYPNSRYEQVIAKEVNFQAYLENPENTSAILKVAEDLSGVAGKVKYAISHDLANGSLNDLIRVDDRQKKYILGENLFGNKNELEAGGGFHHVGVGHLAALAASHPNALLPRILFQILSMDEVFPERRMVMPDFPKAVYSRAFFIQSIARFEMSFDEEAVGVPIMATVWAGNIHWYGRLTVVKFQ